MSGIIKDTEFTKIVDINGVAISSLVDGGVNNGFGIAMMATNFVLSAANSSTVQLASLATFTGAIETIFNQQCISILLTSDQNGTLKLQQYIDLAGARKISTLTIQVVANIPFSRNFVGNGNFFNLTFKNDGGLTTTTLNINTAYGTLPAATNLANAPVSLDEVNGTAFTLGQKPSANSLPVVIASDQVALPVSNTPIFKNTYSSAVSAFVSPLLATDIFTVQGSATKTIKITSIIISGTTTAGSGLSVSCTLVRRSTANTGGVTATPAIVPHDSTSPAATAIVRNYTSNATALGTSIGNIAAERITINTAGAINNNIYYEYQTRFDQGIVLRGTSEFLCINFGGITITGPLISISIEFTEE